MSSRRPSHSRNSCGSDNTRGGLAALVEAADIDNALAAKRQHLPTLSFATLLLCGWTSDNSQADEHLVAIHDQFGDACADALIASPLVPGENLIAARATWLRIVRGAPSNLPLEPSTDGRQDRRFERST